MTTARTMDLNCDLGERDGREGLVADLAMLPYITSANVACGAHAGSRQRMLEIALACRDGGVAFGAHPGFADRKNFGRAAVDLPPSQLRAILISQIGLAADVAAVAGIPLSHIKPHGALYNMAARGGVIGRTLLEAISMTVPKASVLVLSGSPLVSMTREFDLLVREEAFPDRACHTDGTLVDRSLPGAVLHDPDIVALRAVELVQSGQVVSVEGSLVTIPADTLCVHGDHPNALEIVRRIRAQFDENGIVAARPGTQIGGL